MRLYEHEAKLLLAREGIPIPDRYGVAGTLAAARKLPVEFPAVVKAQVLIGGRGKAGGVRRVDSNASLAKATREILNSTIGGYPVERILIEAAIAYESALYIGIVANPAIGAFTLILGLDGGIDIEEAARKRPGSILRVDLDPFDEDLPSPRRNEIARFLAAIPSRSARDQLLELADTLVQAYVRYDCTLLEINPLFVTAGGLVAADAKAVIDNNAIYRQRELLDMLGIAAKRHDVAEPTTREQRAAEAGFAYVDLLPENAPREKDKTYVGLVPGGAGYGIFAIDEVRNIGDRIQMGRFIPLNFMDSGGGPTRAAVRAMFDLIFDHPLVDLVITSRFGGISSCDIFVQGLVECLRARHALKQRVVPVYGRMVGTDLPAARAFLERAQQQTPEPLANLHLISGNERIMADVIREAFTAFTRAKERVKS